MVAREGYAPSIPVCKTGVILFPHRAVRLAAGDGFAPSTSPSESDELLATPSRSLKSSSPLAGLFHRLNLNDEAARSTSRSEVMTLLQRSLVLPWFLPPAPT